MLIITIIVNVTQYSIMINIIPRNIEQNKKINQEAKDTDGSDDLK